MYWFIFSIALLSLTWFGRRTLWLPALYDYFAAKLPRLSDVEKEASTPTPTWLEKEAFHAQSPWLACDSLIPVELTEHEQSFLKNVIDPFCATLNPSLITETGALPEFIWESIRRHRLWGLVLPESDGGHGFSLAALACVITRIASRHVPTAITVMVPNTVGPSAFIRLFGTDAQKEMLPRFAAGEWVGCFALTSLHAGSDAGALADSAVVAYGSGESADILGLTLSWDKRYITLSPRADWACLACRVSDPNGYLPQGQPLGITLVLVPLDELPMGACAAHRPMAVGLSNGVCRGEQIWVPLSQVLGGEKQIGCGWRLLMSELAAGRGLSLPSVATALCQMSFRLSHMYSHIRRQFSRPLIAFEGIAISYGRLAGYAFLSRCVYWTTTQGICSGNQSAVAAAIAKYHMTEMARKAVHLSMDMHAGRAAILGEKNYFETMHAALPVLVTVEGANLLTRYMIIFGQALMQCHPSVFDLCSILAQEKTNSTMDDFLGGVWGRVCRLARHASHCVLSRVTGGWHFSVPKGKPRRHLRHWLRLSHVFALLTDLYLLRYGGALKERESVSALLGDALSHLYMALCVVCYGRGHAKDAELSSSSDWALSYCLEKTQVALIALVSAWPDRWFRLVLRGIVFPTRLVYDERMDPKTQAYAQSILKSSMAWQTLSQDCFARRESTDATGRLELAFHLLQTSAPVLTRLREAVEATGASFSFGNDWYDCVKQAESVQLSESDCASLRALAEACTDALIVDEMTEECAHGTTNSRP